LEIELLLRREGRVRVDLLLEHAQPIADADDLLEERLDRHVFRLHVGLARDHAERAAGPPRRELKIHVDPAVLAEHIPYRLPDAIRLRIAFAFLHLEAVEGPRDASRVAATEHDHVLPWLIGDDAPETKLEMTNNRPDAETWDGSRRGRS